MRPGILQILALALLLAGIAPTVRAETVRVRAGEHASFSRIVIEGAGSKGWSLQRGGKGYVFRAADPAIEYDLSGVFRYIRRNRIADLDGKGSGALELALACNCHASAFATQAGAVVIDVSEGAAPAGSPFEAPDTGEEVKAARAPGPAFPPWQPRPLEAPEADRLLPVYWQGDGPADPHPETPAELGARPTHSPEPPAMSSDPRAAEIREALVGELSRAAAQGLITIDTPGKPEAPPPPQTAPESVTAEPTAPAPGDDPGIPLRIETSIDRDALFSGAGEALSAEGRSCPEDADFAVTDWGEETPPADQIARIRRGLVGEFDRPEREKVVALARLYIHLGFGAEARAVLDAFGIDRVAAPWLRTVAGIVDGEEEAVPALVGFTSCDGDVALWAILETRAALARSDINSAAVLRSFSALPLHLRRLLGPRLVERLVASGDAETAHAVRAAVLRAGPDDSAAMGLADAELALAEGDEPKALQGLDALASGGSADAPEALARAIRLRLDRGEAVPPLLAETAAALAFELRHEPRGAELAGLQILALASTGDFQSAFAEERRWRPDFPPTLGSQVLLELFAVLAGSGDGWTFVNHFYRERERLLGLDPDILLRLDLAERLVSAGLDDEALSFLQGEAAATAKGRLLRAKLALNAGDAGAALALLAAEAGPEAASLRAEAHLRGNAPAKAETEFAASGDAAGAGRAAWIAGDMKGAAAFAPETLAPALQALGLPEAVTEPAAANGGQLAGGRALVAEAETARGALSDLLRFGAETQ